MHKALLFKKLKDELVQCTACNHYCKIAPDKCGICGVRQNKNGILHSLVYGLTSGSGVDNIEKKPLFHFLPGSPVFSIGTIGCNFGCDFCQNAWMSQCSKDKSIPVPPLYELSPEEIVTSCKEKNIKIIAYTYNEPFIFIEYAYNTAKLAKKAGIKNVFVSNGYGSPEAIDLVAPYLDAINIDLKSFSNTFYTKICKAKLEPVLENIKILYEKNTWVEITTLIIPNKNDSTQELEQIAQFIVSVSPAIPWHVIRFTPTYKMRHIPPTPDAKIKEAYRIGRRAGLKYVYAGNIHDEDRHSTYCPECRELLIKRDWGYTSIEKLKNGKCGKCSEKIEGVWK
ncbi:MAG: AmmeMemoRadiSam system radical SAM enzyme [Candidatus Dojkabacteria bacterium]|nr:AmmeMemoRadiSam system radical SAM enzyme [Candidatus Dojkabacteria bacterium]